MAHSGPLSSSHDDHTEYGGGPGRVGSPTNRAPGSRRAPALTPSEQAQRMRSTALSPESPNAMRQRRPGAPFEPMANRGDASPPSYGDRIA
jgi:hypothetical protein